jgi:hypothetical protein
MPRFLAAVGGSSARGGSSLATLIISAVFTLALAGLIGAAMKLLRKPGHGETAVGRGSGAQAENEPEDGSPDPSKRGGKQL